MANTIDCPYCGSGDIESYVEADEYSCNDCGEAWASYMINR